MELNPTKRFTDRVQDYLRFRPSYPENVIEILQTGGMLSPGAIVADIGSGTGILSELFLRHGYRVLAVEPNDAMRSAAEGLLKKQDRFESVNGTAEATTLPANSVDLVTVGQALHWFDLQRARDEWNRILRPKGGVAILFNDRNLKAGAFMQQYDEFLRTALPEYVKVRQRYEPSHAEFLRLFGNEGFQEVHLENAQCFDLTGLVGRVLSSSYAPRADDEGHEELLRGLAELFGRHQVDGKVRFSYDTRLTFGRMT
jgi:ubiquinone/menaquinone biosynthesis C-methylase UbiE